MRSADIRFPTFIFIIVSLLTIGRCGGQQRTYFIGFTDRNNSPYSVQQPLQFLSQRAVDRRILQGIPLLDNDLPVNPAYVDSVAAKGGSVQNQIKWMNGVTVSCDSSVLNSILSLPFVRLHQAVKRTSGPRRVAPKFEEVHGPVLPAPIVAERMVQFDYGGALRQIQQINGDFLHLQGYTGQGIRIAAIDAGFNAADQLDVFDSLFADGRLIATWDFVDRQPSVYEDDAHGTSVLSCMASLYSGTMTGTAPHAEYMLLRSEDANTEYLVEEYNWAAAAAYADSAGCDVITSSLGYFYFDDGAMDHSYADMDGNTTPITVAADIAASKGVMVLSSAGNTGNSSWRYVIAPADADSIITVGAVDSAGFKAGFSAWGPSYDGRIKPDVAAMGERAFVGLSNGSFGRSNGTSFSCPILAGAAACLWQAFPGKTNMEVVSAIHRSSSYYTTPGDSLGYGIPDFQAAYMLLGGSELELPAADELRRVYPVPANSSVDLDFFSIRKQPVEVRLMEIAGRQVLERTFNANAASTNRWFIDLSGIATAGTYLLSVKSEDRFFVRKVVIVR